MDLYKRDRFTKENITIWKVMLDYDEMEIGDLIVYKLDMQGKLHGDVRIESKRATKFKGNYIHGLRDDLFTLVIKGKVEVYNYRRGILI